MRPDARRTLTALALALGFSGLYLSGLGSVPFHPDESTQIHMSQDFDALVLRRDPASLYWRLGQALTPEAEFRLLDAPLARYLIGLSWWLSGYSSVDLSQQWIWGPTWDENVQAGRLPRPEVLLAGRLPLALLGALSTVVIFWIGDTLGGFGVGLAAALLLGLDPLMLLHARRAMAEGALVFFSALAAWGGLRLLSAIQHAPEPDRRPLAWAGLAGLLAGLAVSSKQSLLSLIPAAMLAGGAVLWQKPWPRPQRLKALALVWATIGAASLLVFYALNPILYPQPVTGVLAMAAKRTLLVRDQMAVNDPQIVLRDVPARLGAGVQALFLQPPAAWEAPVYLEQLAPMAGRYFAWPLHGLLRQPPLGWLLLAGCLAGLWASAGRLRRDAATQYVWLWAGSTLALLALTTPLAWQRYFLPLLPSVCLFAALGFHALFLALTRRPQPRAGQALST